jgi:hypothetical protein
VITLASTQKRLVQLEALMEARRAKELETALSGLDAQQLLGVVVWAFMGRDADPEIPPAVDHDEFVSWVRGGLLTDQLPRKAQPAWEQAQDLARRLLAHEDVPELHGLYEWLTQDEAGTARDWTDERVARHVETEKRRPVRSS